MHSFLSMSNVRQVGPLRSVEEGRRERGGERDKVLRRGKGKRRRERGREGRGRGRM